VSQQPPRPRAVATGILQFVRHSLDDKVDEIGALSYGPDGTLDFVFTLDVDAPRPIRNLFLIVRGAGQQWDTLVRGSVPDFAELPGVDAAGTWHLGVQEHGRWLTRQHSRMPMLPAGRHVLRLIANVSGPYSTFSAYVELDDGSLMVATTFDPRNCRGAGGPLCPE
jgi:hypothetical protein